MAGRALCFSITVLLIAAITQGTFPVAAEGGPWSSAASMSQPHQAPTATLLSNGKVLVVGSFADLNTGAEVFDPAANRWLPTGSMNVPRALQTATLLPSGKVLIAGGIAADTTHSTTRTEIYDPITNSWSVAAAMAVQRSSHAATLLPSGRVLVAGGQNASGYIATAELYDPIADSWTMAARMEAGYTSATATLLSNGKVLLAGGLTFGDGRAELFDPATNRWSTAGTAGRIAQTATRLANGRVLITGQTREAQLYDPQSNIWSKAGTMLKDRDDPSATLLSDGRVLVVGGSTSISGQQRWLSSAEIYDPASDRWLPAGCMGQARWENSATLLATKKVLIAGGQVAPVSLSSAELFDPSGVSAGTSIDACETGEPSQSVMTAPSQAAAGTPISTAMPNAANGSENVGSGGHPVRGTALGAKGSLFLSNQPMVAGVLTAIVILGLTAAFYLLARWRRRRI